MSERYSYLYSIYSLFRNCTEIERNSKKVQDGKQSAGLSVGLHNKKAQTLERN